jgi:hypothetical protein
MSIDLSTFWATYGVLSGDTTATNQYDFWRGIVMTGGTQINSQYDFFTFNNTTRYKFFNDLKTTYPDVWDETTFYQNTNDSRIFDFKTFYEYGAQYLSGGTAVICDGWKQAYAHSFSFPSTYSYIDCNGMPQEISIENYDDTTIFCAIGTPVFIGGAIDVLVNIGTCPL